MVIKKIVWISKEAKEAELLITDGRYECIAFSHPCILQEGDEIKDALSIFMTENLMLSYEDEVGFFKAPDNTNFLYRCIAEVVDEKNKLVKIGGIYLYLDGDIPIGCNRGKIVEFNCCGIDV